MSNFARDYYQARTNVCGAKVPPILDGYALPLMGEDDFISIHNPQQEVVAEACGNLAVALGSTHDFLHLTLPEAVRREIPYDPGFCGTKNGGFVATCIQKLLVPKTIGVGKIRDLQAQALARAEISDKSVERLRNADKPETILNVNGQGSEPAEAYIMLSSNVTSGARTIGVHGLVLVRMSLQNRAFAGDPQPPGLVPVYRGGTLVQNKHLGRSLTSDVRTTAQIISENAVRRPYMNHVGSARR